MVKVREDLTNKKFGRLTVIGQVEDYVNINTNIHYARWRCKCDCGNYTEVDGSNLKRGTVRSCGCLQSDNRKERASRVFKKYNTFEIQEDYVIMYTLKGEPFYVDLEDFDKVKDVCWSKDKDGYLRGRMNDKSIKLHRLIMNCPDNMVVDHINHEVSDNRKVNLRIVTQSQNRMNSCVSSLNTSGTTGVSWHKSSSTWRAEITVNYKTIQLGNFKTKGEAIKARKEAEKLYFGEYSCCNN